MTLLLVLYCILVHISCWYTPYKIHREHICISIVLIKLKTTKKLCDEVNSCKYLSKGSNNNNKKEQRSEQKIFCKIHCCCTSLFLRTVLVIGARRLVCTMFYAMAFHERNCCVLISAYTHTHTYIDQTKRIAISIVDTQTQTKHRKEKDRDTKKHTHTTTLRYSLLIMWSF